MEKRLNAKVNQYIVGFKQELRDKLIDSNLPEDERNNLLRFVLDYNGLNFESDDFTKRKRVKNAVPLFERCCAKRANGQQCTRRKKDESQYCGTHSKGTPHGIMSDTDVTSTITKVEVSAIDIKGIIYYLDDKGNVYDTEDIISNKKNPRVIANYVKNGDEYNIPSLFP